jgi:hypothetical protein
MNKKRIPKATRKRLKLLRKVYRPYRPHFGPYLPFDHPIAMRRRAETMKRFTEEVVLSVSAPNQLLEYLRKIGRAS